MAQRRDDDSDDETGGRPAPRQTSLLFGVGAPPKPPSVAYERGVKPVARLEPQRPSRPAAPEPPPPAADEPRWRIRRREAERQLQTDAEVRWGDAWRAMLRAEQWVLDFADGEALRLRRSVRHLSVHAGVVESTVVDGRGKPHRVQLRLAAFAESDWARLARRVVESGARETVATSAKAKGIALALVEAADACALAFLPRRLALVPATCTCGGARIPCDHATGTHLALAKAFDEDPWVLLKVRGADPASLDEWMGRVQELLDADRGDDARPGGTNPWGFTPGEVDWSGLERRRPKRGPWAPPDGWKAKESFDALVRRLLARAGGGA